MTVCDVEVWPMAMLWVSLKTIMYIQTTVARLGTSLSSDSNIIDLNIVQVFRWNKSGYKKWLLRAQKV